MRDGIKGWKKAGYPTEGSEELLDALIALNRSNVDGLMITEGDARRLKNCAFVDFRDKEKFNRGHVKEANHVDYSNMFSKPMMEELNKSNSLIIIHDNPTLAGVIFTTLKLMDYPNVYILQ
ncbi:MAG: rhodanese-like domain-containing protein [Desulfatiglans sp.]|jgi:rhodanese-related sulfurtransferase|nr:rhodanese-like domain-containing protein [Thermodesulfobacteriota bacterium]MEE4352794.1 rhodanese-like domain-containing protein [Desulfatiglans sp.]